MLPDRCGLRVLHVGREKGKMQMVAKVNQRDASGAHPCTATTIYIRHVLSCLHATVS